MKNVTKYLIYPAFVASLGANTYLISGGIDQYAQAAEIESNQPLLSDGPRECTTAQRALIAPIISDHVLSPLNTRFGTSMSLADMRPLNRVRVCADLLIPIDNNNIPQAGAPTGKRCQIERHVWGRQSKSLATPGE